MRAGLQSKVGQGYKFSSVGSRFKRQLGELMEALHRMEPHYIRCIKPNSFNRFEQSPSPFSWQWQWQCICCLNRPMPLRG